MNIPDIDVIVGFGIILVGIITQNTNIIIIGCWLNLVGITLKMR